MIQFDPAPMTSYWRSILTVDLSSTISEINSDLGRKSPKKIFSHPMYFVPLLKGFPLQLGIGARGQKTSDGATRGLKKFYDIFIRLDTIPDRECDRRTSFDGKDRAMLCVVRVKTHNIVIIIIISIRTKSTNTEKQLTQRYRMTRLRPFLHATQNRAIAQLLLRDQSSHPNKLLQ